MLPAVICHFSSGTQQYALFLAQEIKVTSCYAKILNTAKQIYETFCFFHPKYLALAFVLVLAVIHIQR